MSAIPQSRFGQVLLLAAAVAVAICAVPYLGEWLDGIRAAAPGAAPGAQPAPREQAPPVSLPDAIPLPQAEADVVFGEHSLVKHPVARAAMRAALITGACVPDAWICDRWSGSKVYLVCRNVPGYGTLMTVAELVWNGVAQRWDYLERTTYAPREGQLRRYLQDDGCEELDLAARPGLVIFLEEQDDD